MEKEAEMERQKEIEKKAALYDEIQEERRQHLQELGTFTNWFQLFQKNMFDFIRNRVIC